MCRTLAVIVILFCASPSWAHYNMLFPDTAWAKKGEKVTFTYQFGHPFEHELFDAPKPLGLVVLLPQGKKETLDVDKTFTKVTLAGADGKEVIGWRFEYTPAERGDHTFVLKTPSIKIDADTVEDHVKVVLHVQTQNGWTTTKYAFEDGGLDIQPYTRPYGLLPGMVFRGKVTRLPLHFVAPPGLSAVQYQRVEIEKYHETRPKALPSDELITFQAKTDDKGFFVATLPEAGWWGITAIARRKDDTETIRRATLWVNVNEKK